jgi:hypothetical protein
MIMLEWLLSSPESQEVHPKLASKLLQAACSCLPDLYYKYQPHLEGGQPLIEVLRSVSMALGYQFTHYQTRIRQLEQECQAVRIELGWVSQQRDALVSDPLRQRIVDAQAEIKTLSARAEKAELALTHEQHSRTAEQKVWQQEEKRLKVQIADQNKVIARQQLRLSQLLGDASGVENTGGKTS